MKKLLSALIILLVLGFTAQVWATGACVHTSTESIRIAGETQRKYITLTCTSDGSGGIRQLNTPLEL